MKLDYLQSGELGMGSEVYIRGQEQQIVALDGYQQYYWAKEFRKTQQKCRIAKHNTFTTTTKQYPSSSSTSILILNTNRRLLRQIETKIAYNGVANEHKEAN